MENQDNIKTLLNTGAAQAEIKFVGNGIPFVVVPNDYHAEDLEHLLANPIRKRGAIITTDATSFIDYLNKHAVAEHSTIYADIDSELNKCNLVAVLDDHGDELAYEREHTCRFTPKLSVEWGRWLSKNKTVMNQADFATWLEDNLPDIATVPGMPNGAEVLAMALGFEANSSKRVKSRINLQSGGVQFEFVDDEEKDTRTTMKAFDRLTIGVPVFDNSTDAYPVEARLKYREKDGKVSFWYELIRPDRVFKTAVIDEVTNIKQGTSLMVINGSPNIK